MGKIAITLVVALVTASLQCVAACSVLPCNEKPTSPPVPAESCHHKAPVPGDDQHDGKQDESGCGHQTFISEAAPHANSTVFDATFIATLPVVIQVQPEWFRVAEVLTDWSPPPRSDSASITILRL
jgi:hypothetical protein